jgi:peroxiredoxin Q/BCP
MLKLQQKISDRLKMIHYFISLLLILLSLVTFNCEDKNLEIKIGDIAPDFQLPDDTGISRSLMDFRGKKVALYFYPKDNTAGCTKQACSLRDGYQDLKEANIVILGISFDSPESHQKFKKDYNLPFLLLSDENREVAKRYGSSWGILGNLLIKRQTYLIDEQGIIIDILKNVDINQHAQEIINAFQENL